VETEPDDENEKSVYMISMKIEFNKKSLESLPESKRNILIEKINRDLRDFVTELECKARILMFNLRHPPTGK
jgi:hypothetical protein